MTFMETLEAQCLKLYEKGLVPDSLSRMGTRHMLKEQLETYLEPGSEELKKYQEEFASDLKSRSIAEQTIAANEQHYEIEPEFYTVILGKNRKYSSCLFPEDSYKTIAKEDAHEYLDEAENRMFELYATRAQLSSTTSQRVLDLGCGWGSLTLWLAEKYPQSHFVGLSNSNNQRMYIMNQAKERNLNNVQIITGDINSVTFASLMESGVTARFDRILSIEMFEHMKNYELLLEKVSGFLFSKDETGSCGEGDALLFIHIFCHESYPYHFIKHDRPSDWMAQHFFTGGTMPYENLFKDHFQKDVTLIDNWKVNGTHYALTLDAWLNKMDQNIDKVREILLPTYGEENLDLWISRWRAFFFVCAELFGYNEGEEWFVGHYLFKKK